jgi:hypothetical protein
MRAYMKLTPVMVKVQRGLLSVPPGFFGCLSGRAVPFRTALRRKPGILETESLTALRT